MAKVGRVSYFDDLFLYGLANPHKATIALFSTMNNQFTGFLMRLLVISLFHYFTVYMHMYLPTDRRKRGKCCMYAHALPSCPIAPRCTQVLVHAGGVRAHASGKCGCTQVESVAARKC